MSANSKKTIFDFSLFNRIFSYARPYKKQFYFSIFLGILLAIFTPIRPYLIQLTINHATGKNHIIPAWLQFFLPNGVKNNVLQFIFDLTIFQIIFLIIESLARFAFSFLTSWLGQSVVKDLRISIYEKITQFQLRQFDRTPIGTLTTRTINDIESINDIFSDGFIPIIADLLTIIVTLFTMFYIDWKLAIISIIPLPLLFVATYYFKESVNKSFIKVRNAIAQLNAFVQEHISGIAIVQSFAAEDREQTKFEKINRGHRDANIRAIFAYSIFFPVVEIIMALSMGLLIWWISDHKLDSGLLVSFLLYINLIFRPLRVIADKFNVLQMGMVAAERIFKVLDNNDNEVANPKGIIPKILNGKVDFDHVWFAYNDENFVLKNVDFHINPGQTVALVGHTGSGKTSIISLINKLYPIQKGKILIDDISIDKYQLNALRENIGIVLQDVFLFSGSIMENITLRNPNISKEQVIEAAKLINVHDFIMQLPDNYDFNVRERGNTLSLGQRQLISFIRAVLYNPSILVLDEATSSIDTESEILVQNAMEKLIHGRTSIIIAHRLSTIRKADKIIVLDKGVIQEMGSHDELLQLGGFYYKLHEMQYQGEME
ncbi:ABC transporter ATP-binding protein [Rhizosphaericola mali]|uniref:ABC transporter ATP-binding protein n=1 Tax=Rhizosphaericola mali TaxID=2545455 RepID=A0A5P2G5E8_9BACT|nr:ABC transporter ATP-binding protein [Rhizosphaericola mali]QES88980.1 ABC transporter ATP-binding protein [Rhizosphaericola mali]